MALAATAGDGEGVEHVLPHMEAVLRFTQDLNARLAGIGIDGIGGALELYRRLKDVLDGIPDGDVERVLADVHALENSLARLAAGLEEIRRLKTLVPAG
jgi:hypothetical protein